MAQFANGKIEAYVGPLELGAADDLVTVIVSFIAGARSTLSIAVQELDNEAIAQAILDASWRGVRPMRSKPARWRSGRPPRGRGPTSR